MASPGTVPIVSAHFCSLYRSPLFLMQIRQICVCLATPESLRRRMMMMRRNATSAGWQVTLWSHMACEFPWRCGNLANSYTLVTLLLYQKPRVFSFWITGCFVDLKESILQIMACFCVTAKYACHTSYELASVQRGNSALHASPPAPLARRTRWRSPSSRTRQGLKTWLFYRY